MTISDRVNRAWFSSASRSRVFLCLTGWPIIVAFLTLLFILFFVRPFNPGVEDIKIVDVATQWNTSVARLGILPIYPPEEDFYVGDVWAVIADTQDTPLLGSSVRIGHINVRDVIAQSKEALTPEPLPIFPDTENIERNAEYRHQSESEITGPTLGSGIILRITGFPGVVISQNNNAIGAGSWKFLSFFAGSNIQLRDNLSIPIAETYGISTVRAITLIDKWCKDINTSIYCSDSFARRVLAFSVSDRVLASSNGQYSSHIQLRLVTRVFYTRVIETRRAVSSSADYAARSSSTTYSGAPKVGKNETTDVTDNDRPTANVDLANDEIAKIRASQAGSQEVIFHQTFQKPIAFGYRAVTIALQPAPPSPKVAP